MGLFLPLPCCVGASSVLCHTWQVRPAFVLERRLLSEKRIMDVPEGVLTLCQLLLGTVMR